MTTVAVLQSNYIPWKGYFDIIHDVDIFIFYDDVQYTKNDWRNRNRIKAAQGCQWLTIPVGQKLDRLVCDVELLDTRWPKKHWATIQQAYSRSPNFEQFEAPIRAFYLETHWANLSVLNQALIKGISTEVLGVETEFQDSRSYCLSGAGQDRLLDLLVQAGASKYVSGPAAKNYIDKRRFDELGIELIYKDYAGYPTYDQRFPPFVHGVSILDVIFNCGSRAPEFIWGWRSET